MGSVLKSGCGLTCFVWPSKFNYLSTFKIGPSSRVRACARVEVWGWSMSVEPGGYYFEQEVSRSDPFYPFGGGEKRRCTLPLAACCWSLLHTHLSSSGALQALVFATPSESDWRTATQVWGDWGRFYPWVTKMTKEGRPCLGCQGPVSHAKAFSSINEGIKWIFCKPGK